MALNPELLPPEPDGTVEDTREGMTLGYLRKTTGKMRPAVKKASKWQRDGDFWDDDVPF